jgi:phosphoribosylglycinamide formyltransferase-1
LRLICLAGYMRVLSAQGLQDLNAAFPNLCILNLHPARPQDYRGPRGYDHAVQNRFVHWGLTVHRVTAALDEGPVVASSEHVIYPWEDAAMLHHRLMASEHTLFLEAIRKESP